MDISQFRQDYHQQICQKIIRINRNKTKGDYPNFADGDNKSSTAIAWGIVNQLACSPNYGQLSGQSTGRYFEQVTKFFLETSFNLLQHIRPGKWYYSTEKTAISGFYQYEHLAYLEKVVHQDKELGSAMGVGYIVQPDIIVGRYPVRGEEVNKVGTVIDKNTTLADLTPLRYINHKNNQLLLHASISCKWTIRSDRSQNTRTEALNLVRNRKGHTPHIVAVTAEPLPTRIASLALGTGDLDCVYHFALPELERAIRDIKNEDQLDMLKMMIEGRRLRDISDLPFDLAI